MPSTGPIQAVVNACKTAASATVDHKLQRYLATIRRSKKKTFIPYGKPSCKLTRRQACKLRGFCYKRRAIRTFVCMLACLVACSHIP